MAGELRITGGVLARRRIAVPAAADRGALRPTSDKVRAAVMSAVGALLDGARVLDLYAGSGALGIEALSRGARAATFVEKDRRSAAVVLENLASLGLSSAALVIAEDARRALGQMGDASFEVVLVDPPYASSLEGVLSEVARVLVPGGLVVLERDRRTVDVIPSQLTATRDRLYGDTRVVMYAKVDTGSER